MLEERACLRSRLIWAALRGESLFLRAERFDIRNRYRRRLDYSPKSKLLPVRLFQTTCEMEPAASTPDLARLLCVLAGSLVCSGCHGDAHELSGRTPTGGVVISVNGTVDGATPS